MNYMDNRHRKALRDAGWYARTKVNQALDEGDTKRAGDLLRRALRTRNK